MKIIKPSVEFFGAVPTDYESALKFIEKCGRTCYKSEDKITENSAEGFVRKLIKAGHLAMVEHSNFVIKAMFTPGDLRPFLEMGRYLNIVSHRHETYVGGNWTAWFQAVKCDKSLFKPFIDTVGVLFDMPASLMYGYADYWKVCPDDEIPKELHRYSAKFICDRGVSHELVRHRPCSFAQESTRYVNYGGKDMEFIEPWWWDGSEDEEERDWMETLFRYDEDLYRSLISYGRSPQQARAVLPNALKTEIVVTADAAEWAHIRKLRTAKAAHPDIQRVMNMMPWETFL